MKNEIKLNRKGLLQFMDEKKVMKKTLLYKKEIVEVCSYLLFGLAVALFFATFQTARINGESMAPTMEDGAMYFTIKNPRDIQYNDIVSVNGTFVSESVENRSQSIDVVKRVVGLPGDELEFNQNHFYRNGVLIEETYILEIMDMKEDKKIVLSEGEVFVLGDNRNNSLDSLDFGAIPMEKVTSKLLFRLY